MNVIKTYAIIQLLSAIIRMAATIAAVNKDSGSSTAVNAQVNVLLGDVYNKSFIF